ncbi:MAG: carboxymuconolactone decarboxylase family protein [Christensenellales bacterium]
MSLDEKTKELVLIGSATACNCIQCFKWHYNRCIELKISKSEIEEAIDLARNVKVGPGKQFDVVIQSLIKG